MAYELKPTTTMSMATLAGEKARLPCELPLPADRPTLILWYKDHSTKPFYSYDARETASGRHKIHDRTDLAARSRFTLESFSPNFKARLGFLEVDDVTLADTGNYTCRVDFMTSQTMMALLQLSVHEEIQDLEVFDTYGTMISKVAGPYEQASRIILSCRAIGGYPSPVVQWMSGDVLLESSVDQGHAFSDRNPGIRHKKQPLAMSKVILHLPGLQRDDNGRKVKCVAFNSNITRPLTRVITIDMYLPPLEVKVEGLEKPLPAGLESIISCRASGSRPPATLTWKLEGSSGLTPLPSQSSVDHNTTIRRARLLPTPDDNGRTLFCTASNPKVSDYMLLTSIVLNIHFAPVVVAKLAPALDPANIKEGEDVYFECVIKANPPESRVLWLHEGHQLQTDLQSGVLAQGRNLVLQKVSRAAGGAYQCQVTNPIGTVISEITQLDVLFVPECSGSRNVTISVTPSEEIKLNCRVESNPGKVIFVWKVNSSRGAKELDPSTYENVGRTSTLTYRASDHVLPNDQYGVVFCKATNRLGVQKLPCMFIISPAGPPEEPKSCRLRNQSATSLAVTCLPGRNGGLAQHFIATIVDAETREVVDKVNSDTPQFQVTGLAPGRDYLVKVTAVNKKGASRAYVLEGFALKVAENKINDSSSGESSPLLAVFVGVVIGFVFVLIVLAVANRARSRRRRGLLNTSNDNNNKLSGGDEVPLSSSTNASLDGSNERDDDDDDDEEENDDENNEDDDDDDDDGDSSGDGATTSELQSGIIDGSESPAKGMESPSGSVTSRTYLPAGPSGRWTGSLPRSDQFSPRSQLLHSVDLPRVTSKNHKYYTLKINCTRQSNESFV